MIKKNTIDKSSWLLGPWLDEPDDVQWQDSVTGYLCAIERHREFGHLCGYVRVPADHPVYKRHYKFLNKLRVHGGLTFSDVREGEGWWIGFDCAYLTDLTPVGRPAWYYFGSEPVYRTADWVIKETESLALRLKSIQK